jgi:hypothetical protein
MLVKPIDFANVFAVSIAIHLAYTLLYDVRRHTLQPFQDSVQHLKDFRNRFDQTQLSTDDLEYKMVCFERASVQATDDLRPLIRSFSIISTLTALFSLGCLVFAGFQPGVEWSVWKMIFVLALAILPMPLFSIITHFRNTKVYSASAFL